MPSIRPLLTAFFAANEKPNEEIAKHTKHIEDGGQQEVVIPNFPRQNLANASRCWAEASGNGKKSC